MNEQHSGIYVECEDAQGVYLGKQRSHPKLVVVYLGIATIIRDFQIGRTLITGIIRGKLRIREKDGERELLITNVLELCLRNRRKLRVLNRSDEGD